ncbi:MAG: PEP-CTERM sorting domain-containing protein [Phycisphaeraceae bacterium]
MALSNFTANTTFSTDTPISDGAMVGDPLVVEDGAFVDISDQDFLGSTSLGDYRLSMDGTVESVGGLGNSVANYQGDYSIVLDDGMGGLEEVSYGNFDMQATSSVLSDDVLLNASFNEQGSGSGGLSIGDSTISAISNDGRSFSALFNAGGGISGSGGGGVGGGGIDPSDFDCELLCGHDHSNDDINGDGGDPTVVPEPTSLAVLGVFGAAAMMRRGRRSRKLFNGV